MTPYTNTNPCPRCGGLDYYYMVGDGYINPDYPTHYSHASTSSTCKKCGYQENFWNHKDGFVPQQPYQHSITINNNPTDIPYCILPLTDNTFLSFKPGDVFLAIQLWNSFQLDKNKGTTEALKNVKKALNQQS